MDRRSQPILFWSVVIVIFADVAIASSPVESRDRVYTFKQDSGAEEEEDPASPNKPEQDYGPHLKQDPLPEKRLPSQNKKIGGRKQAARPLGY